MLSGACATTFPACACVRTRGPISWRHLDFTPGRALVVTMFRIMIAGSMAAAAAIAATNAPVAVTFHKDVLPILQKNCQGCHRPGEIAPMSLLTYSEARPWAKAIKVAVATQKMPPWFAEAQFGHFANDRRLSQAEVDTLVNWADAGAPEGNPKDAPAALTFQDGWN